LPSLSDNLGATVNYAYDLGARLTNVTLTDAAGNSAQVSLTYDNANRLTNVNRIAGGLAGNNVNTTLTYDNADRLTNIKHKYRTSTTLANYAYSFDAANQLTSYTGPDGTLNYSYDATGELTGVTGAHSESYSYDLNGNRTMSGYVTTTGNRLQTDGTYNYAYDNDGNMLTKTRISDGQSWNFTWDYRNRLTDVVVKNASGTVLSSQHNTYDVFDRRIGVSTTINGVTTQMWTVYDGANTYADFDGNGNLTNRYLYGLTADQLFGKMDSSGNTRWYLTDLLGSIRLLTTPSGSVLDTVNYDGFGNILSESSPTNGDRFKYTSREWDKTTSLQFNRARYYDPNAGRWIAEDPLEFAAGDANFYRYVTNSIPNFVDPSGLDEKDGKGKGITPIFNVDKDGKAQIGLELNGPNGSAKVSGDFDLGDPTKYFRKYSIFDGMEGSFSVPQFTTDVGPIKVTGSSTGNINMDGKSGVKASAGAQLEAKDPSSGITGKLSVDRETNNHTKLKGELSYPITMPLLNLPFTLSVGLETDIDPGGRFSGPKPTGGIKFGF
jgi:RHS repeat-associated protein